MLPGAVPQHGSPSSLAYTGTVYTELVPILPSSFTPSPKKYCTPSGVITFQYSLSLSPLANVPVCCSTRQRGSRLSRHCFGLLFGTRTISAERPFNDNVALSFFQHRSPSDACPSTLSSLHGV